MQSDALQDQYTLEDYIQQLQNLKPQCRMKIKEQALLGIIKDAIRVFAHQPMLLRLKAPIKVCGDIHGQFQNLLNIFDFEGNPKNTNYLFLGDYVDRGTRSIETITLLLLYKIKYQNRFFLLRGNHECASINRVQNFYQDCLKWYGQDVFEAFSVCFEWMPVCALIGKKILCMHGGISKQLHNLEQIQKIKRPTEIPQKGLLCDLLWSDPSRGNTGWKFNKQRGISYQYGQDIIKQFLKKHNLELICRGHQMVKDGYQMFADRGLITLFSAPNYCKYENNAAILSIGGDLQCNLNIIAGKVKHRGSSTRVTRLGSKNNLKLRSMSFQERQSLNNNFYSRFNSRQR